MHDFLRDEGRLKAELYWIRKVWYLILLVLFTIYVGCNFKLLVTQSFTSQFDGNSLILILWLILLLMPIVDSIEGYGFKLNKKQAEQEKQAVEIKLLKDGILKSKEIPDIKELESRFETIQKESENE